MPSQIGSTTYRLRAIIVTGEICEILLPFHGKHVLLFVVAVFTSCSNVVLSAPAPADHWNDVIHCQFIWRKTVAAVIADATG